MDKKDGASKDREIMDLLQQDSSLSVGDIARKVGLSVTPCWRRIQKLEEAGIIRGRVALLDKDKLGLGAVVKARDGNKRGAEVAIGAVIRALGYPIEESVKGFFQPKLLNWAGDEVGDITTPAFALTG